jgi:hypothetical protein
MVLAVWKTQMGGRATDTTTIHIECLDIDWHHCNLMHIIGPICLDGTKI